MIAAIIISTALAAFFCGFFIGVIKHPLKPNEVKFKKAVSSRQTEKLIKEYYNFLNYDGSDQS